jgi:hypothetical protein
MSTELEPTVDAEIVSDPAPLSETEAMKLDGRIQRMVGTVAGNMDTLLTLLEEAAKGEIHVALSFPSWPAYVQDRVKGKLAPTEREERKALVALMGDRGMSQRAIAASLGVSKKTVQNDQAEQVDTNYPPDTATEPDTPAKVIGIDGKRYQRERETKPKRQPFMHTASRIVHRTDKCAYQIGSIARQVEELRGDAHYPEYRWGFDQAIGNALCRLTETVAPNLTAAHRDRIMNAVLPRVEAGTVDRDA